MKSMILESFIHQNFKSNMSNTVNIKRQSTLKTVIKCTKKNGVEIEFSRYSNASPSQTNEERLEHIKSEGFILSNGNPLYLEEIQKAFESSLLSLIASKEESGELDVSIKSHIIITE